jgi:hypothetical protein
MERQVVDQRKKMMMRRRMTKKGKTTEKIKIPNQLEPHQPLLPLRRMTRNQHAPKVRVV